MPPSFNHLRFDEHGRPLYTVSTRSTRTQNETEVPVFPTKAIPIVFLPGVMGSPLRAFGNNGDCIQEGNRWAWFPDGEYGWVAGGPLSGYRGFSQATPQERRTLLDPDASWALEPDADDFNKDIIKKIHKSLAMLTGNAMSTKEALRRGWATVYWSGYGTILSYLEKNLRLITYSQDPYSAEILAMGENVHVFEPIQDAFNTVIKEEHRRFNNEALKIDFPNVNPQQARNYKSYIEELRPILKTGREYHYPVFAVGYNWLRCNEDSADYVYERITSQILPHVRNVLGYTCDDGIILLTHSMGGLVARSLVRNHEDLKVLSVIHGVQPCNGAATLYARMWAGWEGSGVTGTIAGRSLGYSRAELLPILTQSPGAMELAPNQNYAKGWLRIYDLHNNNRLLKALPVNDPYSEIYLQTKNWLRLGSYEQMNPAARNDPEKLKQTIEGYRKVIDTAKDFHQNIDNFFHPNTYLLYGQFNNHMTWGAVNLRVQHMQLSTIVIPDDILGGMTSQEILSPTRQPVPMAVIESATFEDIPARNSGIVNMTHDGQTYQVRMDGAAEPGDGTVPYNSANPWKAPSAPWIPQNWKSPYRSSDTPAGIKYIFEFKNNDFDHAESYNEQVFIDTTYYCIMSVIKNKLT